MSTEYATVVGTDSSGWPEPATPVTPVSSLDSWARSTVRSGSDSDTDDTESHILRGLE